VKAFVLVGLHLSYGSLRLVRDPQAVGAYVEQSPCRTLVSIVPPGLAGGDMEEIMLKATIALHPPATPLVPMSMFLHSVLSLVPELLVDTRCVAFRPAMRSG